MVAAASPSAPPLAPHAAADRPHPTYSKMITHALTELGGASARPAIAAHILARFSGLPARHDDLLSAHLRRLVAEGVLRTGGADSYIFDPPPPSQEDKRGPGRPPRKDSSDASTPVATAVPVVGEKRGRGRPRKTPQASSEKPARTAAPSLLPAKRKREQSPPGKDKPLQQSPGSVLHGHDDSVTKTGPGKPATHQAAPIKAGAEAPKPVQAVGQEARTFQNATPVQSGGVLSAGIKRGRGRPRKDKTSAAAAVMSPGIKRGRGRPRKEKPSEAAQSPATAVATSRGFKKGCGRPSMGRPSAAARSPEAGISAETSMEKLAAAAAAAMYAETGGDAAASAGIQAGGGQSRIEKLAAAVAAMSAEGIKKCERPRKEKPPAPAGAKRSRGRPRKDQCITGLVEAACEALFRDMMTEASTRRDEDLASVAKTQTEEGVAPGDRKETRAADAGCVPVSGENAASAPVGAADSDLGPANPADDVVSTGVKKGRGRPRKNKPAAAMSDETGDAASAGMEAGGGTPRMEDASVARSPETGDAASTGVKRGRGRPRKNKPAAAMSSKTGGAASTGMEAGGGTPRMEESAARFPETGDAASTAVKRGRGRPRKNPAAAMWVKRPRGRPRKNPAAAMSSKTGVAASTWVKGGRGRPRKKKPAAPAEGKRRRGRPRKDQPFGTGSVESAGEVLFSDVESAGPGDSVLAGKTQTEGIAAAPGDKKEARVADAGRAPASGENAASAPVGAVGSVLDYANL